MGFPIRDAFKTFKDLNIYEIWWAITHIDKIWGVWKLSEKARETANRLIEDPDLDADYAGGQIDALRHILWMALITKRYGANVARSLGRAYERGNKWEYKKGKLEEYYLPDAASMMMDLMNNEIGIEIGLRFPDIRFEDLVQEIKKLILEGKAWKIKKDLDLNFLDESGRIIPRGRWLGKWQTPKIIVPSDLYAGSTEKVSDVKVKSK